MTGLKFCPKCGTLMRPDRKKGVWVCPNCGYEEPITDEDKKKTKITQKVEHRPDEGVVIVDQEVETLPTTRVYCPKCGEIVEAYWWEVQTRAGDEPSTIFYKCKKCGYVWRSYE